MKGKKSVKQMIYSTSKGRGKRGNITSDSIILVVALLFFIIVALVAYKAFTPVYNNLQSEQQYSNESRQLVADFSPRYAPMLDDIALILLLIFWLGSIAFAFLIDTNPVFFVIAFILFIAVLVAVAAFQESLVNILEGGFSDVKSEFPKIFFIANNLMLIVIGFVITVGVSLYAKFAR